MDVLNIRHKGLRRFVTSDDASGLPADFVEKIRNIVSFLQEMESADELKSIVTWRAHQLSGDRKGVWSLTVTRNWRTTFRIDESGKAISDLDYEDYH
jgi:proteic killer suppression protein